MARLEFFEEKSAGDDETIAVLRARNERDAEIIADLRARVERLEGGNMF